ncbi:YkoF family thiamine/hydroxymethylpyrimidine-binding protein [Gilvimarinus sp. F26214L]|uniref:YkoF family thiamine/hydroxymethylpyrimidine-binding protein n=1 Tax=Gilvimarinus sp. DZF01 TaxID=3461371 RepID=UPI00404602F1
MQMSAELSFYPLKDDYLDVIRATVKKLNSYPDVKVRTFPTATILVGDFERVMEVIKDVVAWSYSEYGKGVFVAKLLPGHVAD